MRNSKNVILGIILIAAGVIFGTNALGLTDINIFFDGWWTLFIIVPCAVGLITNRDKTGNLIGLLIGVALLLTCQNVVDFGIMRKMIVPVLVILVGVSLLFKGRSKESVLLLEEAKKNGASPKQCFAAFSGQNVDYTNEVFEGAGLNAVFGGIKCDLRNAIFEKDTVIKVSCIFGGAELVIKQGDFLKAGADSKYINCRQDGNKILITEKRQNLFGRSSKSRKVTVYVPENMVFDEAEINVGAGTVTAETINAKRISLDIDAGEMIINSLNVTDEAEIDGGAGSIRIESGSIANLDGRYRYG